jgi:hypothetical protein
MANAPAGTACTESGGKLCDGLGECVECLGDGDCGAEQICDDNACVAEHCVNGQKDVNETGVDCGGPDCNSCQNGQPCNSFSDCDSMFCNEMMVCMACTMQSECSVIGGHYCDPAVDDGTCVPEKMLNETCADAVECDSGNCVDGVCCDSACDGTCQTCSGVMGQCSAVAMGSDPDNECAPSGPCGSTGEGCNGSSTNPGCIVEASGTACGDSCTMGTANVGGTCDGMGSCTGGSQQSCAPFACDGDVCGSSCSGDGDCASSAYCDYQSACVTCGAVNNTNPNVTTCGQGDCMIVDCPAGAPCEVNCSGNGACSTVTVNCPAGFDCTVNCGTGNNVCAGININCGDATNCDLNCSDAMNACSGATLTCGPGECTATCASGGSMPNVSCGPACTCTTC